jgi:type II secretory pathway pseudopilin PulG
MNKHKNNQGFTLLEMTVSLGVFIILFTLTLGIYSQSIRAEQRTIQISKLQREAQLVMEVLAKKVRSSKVDYEYYGGTVDTVNGEADLALLDKSGNQTVFRLGGGSISVCLEDCSGSGVFTSIPSSDITITSLTFFVTPAVNPFSLHAPPAEFPKITIVVNLQNTVGTNTRDLLIQQTIPQRLAGI